MSRGGIIGLGLLAAFSGIALVAFLVGGRFGEGLFTVAVATFPVGLYLTASGRAPFRLWHSFVPATLWVVLVAGLVWIDRLAEGGIGAAGLWVMIVVLWFLPLILLSTSHMAEEDGDRIDEALADLRNRFGRPGDEDL